MAKIITTLCLIMGLLMGGEGEDPNLCMRAKTAFLAITQAEDLVINQQVAPEVKEQQFFDCLKQVATEPLISNYQQAWKNQDLGITLTVERFNYIKAVQTSSQRALVLIQVEGTITDESGSESVKLNYLLVMKKQAGKWLLSNIQQPVK